MLPIAYSIFVANFLFGLLVKGRIIDSSRFRMAHHLLYFFTVASLLVALLLAAGDGTERIWILGGMTVLLFGMPLFKGRTRGHWLYATFCSVVYSAIVWQYS